MTTKVEVWQSIPTMFARGKDHLVLPIMNPDCNWLIDNGSVNDYQKSPLLTIMIDGICVKVTLTDTKWEISKRMGLNAFMKTNREDSMDAPIWNAFDNLEVKTLGIYEVYGKDFKNNPYNLDKNLMIKVFPVDSCLIVGASDTKIKWKKNTSEEDLYNSIKSELEESPEIEGLVFHQESNQGMELLRACKIRRKDFGLPWPVPMDTPSRDDKLILHLG